MASERLDAAVHYATRNWRVIPLHYIRHFAECPTCSCWHGDVCKAAGKHPLISGWRKAATTDVSLIRLWWKAWPLANVGLLMGGEARLVTIDVDGEEGRASLAKLEVVHGPLPLTLSQVTGRIGGGEHRLFKVPPGLEMDRVRNRVKIAPGIDVRAEGGLIVAAPSIHPTGTRYRWINDKQPVCDTPDWLFKLATSPKARQEAISTHGSRPSEDKLPPLDERIQKAQTELISGRVAPAIQGQNGSRACLHAAILLVRGYCLPPEAAYDLLWHVYNPLCLPPWSEQELMHKVESAELHVDDVSWGYMTHVDDPSPAGQAYDALLREAQAESAQSEAQALASATPQTVHPVVASGAEALYLATPETAWRPSDDADDGYDGDGDSSTAFDEDGEETH
jgi:hypothetical protein